MPPRALLSRRRLSLLAFSGAACVLAAPAVRAFGAAGPARRLELANTHTGETLDVVYREAAGLIPAALARLEHLLRDHRANEQHAIDPGLYDQLTDLALAAGCEPRFEVISGYRSARTNAGLARVGSGVASRSLHIEGRAIDVRLAGCPTDRLRDLALAASRGGVGYYARSDFVHLDTGRPRTWTG